MVIIEERVIKYESLKTFNNNLKADKLKAVPLKA